MPLEMPPETIPILVIAFFFFIFLFIRTVRFAFKTREKAYGHSSIVALMFASGIVSILLGYPFVWAILMIIVLPYSIFILLKYWKRLIFLQKEKCKLKGFSTQEPMKASDYLSLLFSSKGWLKLAEKQGKNRTIFFYILFNALIFSILVAWASYRFPNFFLFPLSLIFIVPVLILYAYFFGVYLDTYQSDQKGKL